MQQSVSLTAVTMRSLGLLNRLTTATKAMHSVSAAPLALQGVNVPLVVAKATPVVSARTVSTCVLARHGTDNGCCDHAQHGLSNLALSSVPHLHQSV